jgi:hypothetical protein
MEVQTVEGYFTYTQWVEHTVNKIVSLAWSTPEKHRDDWLRVQIEAAIRQSFRHGRSGKSESDPVEP